MPKLDVYHSLDFLARSLSARQHGSRRDGLLGRDGVRVNGPGRKECYGMRLSKLQNTQLDVPP